MPYVEHLLQVAGVQDGLEALLDAGQHRNKNSRLYFSFLFCPVTHLRRPSGVRCDVNKP